MDTLDYIDATEAALVAIDRHLALIPADRTLITVEEHVDFLLDLRNILNGEDL